jgi:transcriptional regulator with XRE-family HTH domain
MLLSETLVRRRRALGISQSDLARRLGVQQQTVSRWENGDSVPRPVRIVQLAAELHVGPDDLLRSAGYMPKTEPPPIQLLFSGVFDRLPSLSDGDLFLLLDRTWEEFRGRRRRATGTDGHRRANAGGVKAPAGPNSRGR